MGRISEIEFLEIEEKQEYSELIEKVLKKCFSVENLDDTKFYVSITLTTSENIRKYNKEYRNIDKETDVLSFPMFEKEEIENLKSNAPKFQDVLGDMIISIDKVKQQAIEYGHSFERELAYMVVHSFYHLLGEDHIEEEEKKQMRQKEENVLSKLNIKR